MCLFIIQAKLKPNMAKMFSMMHQSVNEFSRQMLVEMRRHNYVTPTNYLELVDGFKQLRSLDDVFYVVVFVIGSSL